jgi:hypothetical protein
MWPKEQSHRLSRHNIGLLYSYAVLLACESIFSLLGSEQQALIYLYLCISRDLRVHMIFRVRLVS